MSCKALLITLTIFILTFSLCLQVDNKLKRLGNLTNIPNKNSKINHSAMSMMSQTINAFCYIILDDVVYDISSLYDSVNDYVIHSNSDYFYFNFCKFGTSKCKKDNAYISYFKNFSQYSYFNNTDCNLLSGTNYENVPKWNIISKNFE